MDAPRKMVAYAYVCGKIDNYDRIVVEPVLADYVCGRKFRREDRHRLFILLDYIGTMIGAPVEVERLATAAKGAL